MYSAYVGLVVTLYIKGGTQTEGVSEQGAEEDIWAEEG
jgi:hypothetical protein